MKRQRRQSLLALAVMVLASGCVLFSSKHDPRQYTELFAAASRGDLPTVRRALQGSPGLVRITEWDRATLLHDAVGQNHEDMAQFLLDKGADINAATADGLTPLHMAAQNGNLPIISLLLGRGAKVNARDAQGWTPLDRATKWLHPEAVSLLRSKGGISGADGR